MCFIFFFFSSQFLQCVDFKITSKTFPVDSKHASPIPVLDDQPRLFRDPQNLALMLIDMMLIDINLCIFWLIAFSKLESCPVLCNYNFVFSTSSFSFSSNSFSHFNEIDSVWLFQLCGLIGLSIFKTVWVTLSN